MSTIMQLLFPRRILAIDSDVIHLIPLVVENRGNCWEISIALDGLAGISLARETVPDLILIRLGGIS
jgi:hypothetical protein